MDKSFETADATQPVVVFTCGRTGSTLFIRILNCLPRTIVWGEHNGSLKPLLNSYSRFREVAINRFVTEASELLLPVYERQPIVSERGMSIEWLNWFTQADIDRLYREMITGLFYPEPIRERFSRWGFKEIRYREFELGMLRKLFPGMKAIILYRNPAAVFASQFTHFAKNDGERVPRVLKNIEAFYQFAAREAMREREPEEPASLFVSYEEIAGQFSETLLKLQDFLGEEFLNSVEEIRNNIARFQEHRARTKWTGEPDRDFDSWAQRMEIPLPEKQIRSIVSCYRDVVQAKMARPTERAH